MTDKKIIVPYEISKYDFNLADFIMKNKLPKLYKGNGTTAQALLAFGKYFLDMQETEFRELGFFYGVPYKEVSEKGSRLITANPPARLYQEAMDKMERLYPNIFKDKTKHNADFLAAIGLTYLKSLAEGKITMNRIPAKAN